MPEADQSEPIEPAEAPSTTVAQATAFPATISLRPHVWLNWARIAIRQEGRVWEARNRGLSQPETPGQFMAVETDEAIQAVTASRHCLHNLWRAWGLGENEKSVTLRNLTTATSTNPATWRTRLKQLVIDRNGVVHHDEVTTPAQPHPVYATNVSGLAASFTAERATEAVDVLLNDVLRLVITAPAPALATFARDYGHVLASLDLQRTTGTN
jgi:hypothetical protein